MSQAFNFVEPGSSASLTGAQVDKATVRFSGYTTAVFEYDAFSAKYLKSQYGEPHVDANTGEQVAVDNVIIIYSPTSQISGTYLTRYDLTSGTGVYLSHGLSQEFEWSKGDYNDPFVFTDENGDELSFNTGKTWVCVVPQSEIGSTVLENTAAQESAAE